MYLLTTTSDSIRIVTSTAAIISVSASYIDSPVPTTGVYTPGRQLTTISSATTATLVQPPAASVARNIRTLLARNDDGALNNTIAIQVFDGSASYTIWQGTLAPKDYVSVNEQGTVTYVSGGVPNVPPALTLSHIDLISDASPSVGPEFDWKGFNGRFFIGIDVANSPTSRDFVLTGVRGTYSFPDGATTNSSPTLTSPSGGGFTIALIGASVSGPNIPNGTTVLSVANTTSLTMSANATATASGQTVTMTRASVQDLLYWKHRGALSPCLGVGVTPPDGSARLQVSGQDDEPAMGTVRVRVGSAQTGKAFTIHDSTPVDRLWVDNGFYLSGNNPTTGSAVAVQAETSANGRAIAIASNDKATVYGLSMPTGSGGVMRVACLSGGSSVQDWGTDGSTRVLATLRTSAAVRLDSEIAPSALGADQNDYSPTNLAITYDLLLSASVANVNITGIASPSSGRELYVYNIGGSNTITLKHQNAGSVIANRIIGRSNADVVLSPGQGVLLRYSGSQSRWIVRHAP